VASERNVDPSLTVLHAGARLDEVRIPMSDGVELAANRFLPATAGPGDRFPVILEYLPYRKDDGLIQRDWDLYPYMAARGYACVKVDIRGTGRSGGVLPDREYSDVEHADGDEVIQWLAAQPWSTGAVGMWGISWGGFNAIQMGFRDQTPDALRGIVAIDATDDLFRDDVHLIDGLLHIDEYDVMIDLDNARAAAPDFVLDEDTLQARFDQYPWKLRWLREQRDGAFWERASLRPDHDRLRVPALLIGGWYDGYRDSVLRMLERCRGVPVRGILAPHDHSFPHRGRPGPPFEHRAEAVRWFDRWLRDERNGIEDEPKLAVYMRRWHRPGLDLMAEEIPGEWRLEDGWPVDRLRPRRLMPSDDRGLVGGGDGGAPTVHELRYTPSGGGISGMWWGDLAFDQRPLDEASLVYDSPPMEKAVEILGFPRAHLVVESDAAVANWFVRLCDVSPEGAVTLVTGAGLSGPQSAGSTSDPVDLEPGRVYAIDMELHATSWVFEPGHRVRFSVSNALWPMIWPTPSPMVTGLHIGGVEGSWFELPVLSPTAGERRRPRFEEPGQVVEAPGFDALDDPSGGGWERRRDGSTVTVSWRGGSAARTPWGEDRYEESLEWRVDDEDPAHASVEGTSRTTVRAGGRLLEWTGVLKVASDAVALHATYRRELRVDGGVFRERKWHEDTPRDHH
jgi:uncharacterized protein